MNHLLILGCLSFLGALFGSWIIIRLSQKHPFLIKNPTPSRWHHKPVPSFGGIAIFGSFALVFAFLPPFSNTLRVYMLGLTSMFMLGLLDDIFSLTAYQKLTFQIIIATMTAFFGIHFTMTEQALIYIPCTIFWIVAITNAFNLVDNMDGLSGGLSFIGCVFLGLSLLQSGSLHHSLPLFLLALSLLGFLWFNKFPARIFMGDCGALSLGYTLGFFSILDSWKSTSNLALMMSVPTLLCAVPIFDTLLVTINRKLNGMPITQGGKDHSSHRLVSLGLNEPKAVLSLCLCASILGAIAVFSNQINRDAFGLMISFTLVMSIAFGIFLTDTPIYETSNSNGKIKTNLFFKRRMAEIVLDAILIWISYYLSFLLRFDWTLNPFHRTKFYQSLPYVFCIQLLMFLVSGLYKGAFSYIDFSHFKKIFLACFFSTLASVLLILALFRFEGFSRTLFAINFVVLIFLVACTRAFLRWLKELVIQETLFEKKR